MIGWMKLIGWMKVCTETEKEPQLQSVTGECLYPQSANRKAEARPDIKAKGFWCRPTKCIF